MSFLVYDLAFLVLFTLFVIIFLYINRKNLKREGIMYLYRTKLGIRFINYVGGKYKKTLNVLQYFAIVSGYLLMAGIFYVLIKTIYIYFATPQITQIIKAPPVVPLLPYFPALFGLQSFFPNFYFIYFIIVILVMATVHEFSHGIFARFNKIKIKSTGFGFLGPILAAFVEPDEKQMRKKSNLAQMSILSAGTFANVITAAFFLIIMYFVFLGFFHPVGVFIDGYSYSILNKSDVLVTGGMLSIDGVNLTKISYENRSYFADLSTNFSKIAAFQDLPAINKVLRGAITQIDGKSITGYNDIANIIGNHSAGDKVSLTTNYNNREQTYNITLGKSYFNKNSSAIGVLFQINQGNFANKVLDILFFYKQTGVYYKSGEVAGFIYGLLFWLVLINFFGAIFNMLPLGIFDGGRFFFLTFLAITKKEKTAVRINKYMSYLIALIFFLLVFSWILALFS